MGFNFAYEIYNNAEISLEDAVKLHFRTNCYPPIPDTMVPVAVQAIQNYDDDEYDAVISLPEGVSFRGSNSVNTEDAISGLFLHGFLPYHTDNDYLP